MPMMYPSGREIDGMFRTIGCGLTIAGAVAGVIGFLVIRWLANHIHVAF